jgi:hypothetical protein
VPGPARYFVTACLCGARALACASRLPRSVEE